MKSEYKSGKSVGKNKTVPINVDDPRLNPLKAAITKARLGAEIEYIGIDSRGVLVGGSTNASGTTGGNVTTNPPQAPPVYGPAVNNQPPSIYPGGSGSYVINLGDPSGLSAAWSGDTLNVTFTWDSTLPENATASQFVIKLTTTGGATAYTPFNTFQISQQTPTGTSYTLGLTKTIITSMFNIWVTSFSQVCIEVADPNNNLNASGLICADISGITAHVFGVNKPHITVTAVSNGYKVAYGESSGTYGAGTADGTFPTSSSVDSVEIWELEGASTPTPTITLDGTGTPTGWTRVYFGKLDPVNITTQNFNGRWIIARFKSLSAENTSFCDPAYIIPTSPVTVNTKVPTSVSSVSAVWSVNDISLTYTLPGATASITNVTGDGTTVTYTASNNFAAGNIVTITGITTTASAYNVTGVIVSATSTYFTLAGSTNVAYTSNGTASSTNNSGVRFQANLVSPTGTTGSFYFYPDGTGNLTQTGTIKKSDLYAQFGAYFSSFTSASSFQSISIVGVKDAGVSFSVAARTTSLTTVTPTPTIVATIGGYTATFDFSSTNATYAKVYRKYTTASWPSRPDDVVTMDWVSGGASGTNTMIVTNVRNEYNSLVSYFPEGYLISGSNIPSNTFISAVSGTGPNYTITLSTYDSTNTNVVASNFTATATGTYTAQGLIYSGTSPANVFSNFYVPTHIVLEYYDDFGSASLLSTDVTRTPINPALSVINNAIQIGGGGAIYVGGSATSGARIVLGPSQNAPDGSQYSGIFAFDGGATSGTAATTSVISNPTSGSYTFETVNAKIADWAITSNKIESLIISGITKYTGLSASNTSYSFWAGASSSGNSTGDAPFSVSPTGAVIARNMQIVGGNLDIGSTSYTYTATGSTSSTTLTVSSVTGLSQNMYVVGYGIASGTTIYSVGTSTVVLSTAPTKTFTGSSVTFISTDGAHITNSGILYATGANVSGNLNVTGSSIFGGNINVSTAGSIYSGTLVGSGSAGTVSNGYILNSNGIYFSTSGTSTTTLTATSLVTTAATIGGWTVNSTGIHHTGANNTSGNIDINSAGNISVSATNISGYTAGINGAYVATGAALLDSITGTPSGVENVFWAGSGGATSTSNAFRVTLGGNLYASNASITGVVQTGNTLGGKITLDGNKDWASLSTTTGTSYIFPRNGNLYITSPAAVTPYSTAVASGNPTATEGKSSPTGTPYFATGSAFKDSWGNTVSGIGLYTGNWDYFSATSGTLATAASKPFITTTTSGIQISGSADVGMIIEQGGATNDAFSTPTILMYTSKALTAPYAPSTLYGSWATFQPNKIVLGANSSSTIASISIQGDSTGNTPANSSVTISGTSTVYALFNNSGIQLRSGASRSASDSDYNSESYITLGAGGTGLYAMPLQENTTTVKGGGTMSILSTTYSHYANSSSLGAQPRQRMLVEDPISGQVKLGMAVYYQSGGSGPSNAGFVGDLWVQY